MASKMAWRAARVGTTVASKFMLWKYALAPLSPAAQTAVFGSYRYDPMPFATGDRKQYKLVYGAGVGDPVMVGSLIPIYRLYGKTPATKFVSKFAVPGLDIGFGSQQIHPASVNLTQVVSGPLSKSSQQRGKTRTATKLGRPSPSRGARKSARAARLGVGYTGADIGAP